jgi:hypothetical protein
MANPTAIPGTVVSSGALVSPGGGIGLLGLPGAAGSAAVSADSGNRATLGSDSRIYVPASSSVLADNTRNGLLKQVSGSTRDLVDGTNNVVEAEVRATWKKRYYYCWHCDHPLSATQTTSLSAGATATQVASQANHPGIYNLNTGATNGNFAAFASSTVADFQLGFFTKLAFRCVFNASAGADWILIGFTDSLGTYPPVNGMIFLGDNNAGFSYVRAYNAGASTNLGSSGSSPSGWWDCGLSWDATNGLRYRIGTWNGTSTPTLMVGGPTTSGLPATTVNMFWQVMARTQVASASQLLVDLVEVCGEYASPGTSFRGEELITAF